MKIDHFLFVDFETYYDREYSLRKMSVPEYILHPQFAVQLLAVYDIAWDAPKVIEAKDIPAFLEQYPAKQTACCSHNALFDLAILSWKYGWVPGRCQDTLGMTRSLRTYQKYSLDAVLKELFGYSDKGDVIYKVMGMRVQDIMNAGLWPDYKSYAMRDVRNCANIYFRLYKEFPEEEQEIMDLVLRAAIVPCLHADVPLLQDHLKALRKHKAQLLADCGYDKAALMSTQQFQEALESLGVEIKTKPSPNRKDDNGDPVQIPAFSKTDAFMQGLLEYAGAEDESVNHQVQCLAAARLSHKSTIEETRAERFVNIAQLPWGNGALLPVPLRYGGAHTHRLSGEWSMNMQNLPRRRADLPDEKQSRLRTALKASPGHKLIAADLSQIEARIVAVLAEEESLIEAFRKGEDVYASFASLVFNKPVTDKKSPERFVGKTGILGLGYGCGSTRFFNMVVSSAKQFGISLDDLNFDENTARKTVHHYRKLYRKIASTWTDLDNHLLGIIHNTESKEVRNFGPVKLQLNRVVLPNGMGLRYALDDKGIYGAKLLENITQALARIVIMQAALRLAKRGYRFVLQAHDELVYCVHESRVDRAKVAIMEEMLRVPKWMPNLPLAAEIGVGENYGACK